MSKKLTSNPDYSKTKEEIKHEIALLKGGFTVKELRTNPELRIKHNPAPAVLLKPDEKVKLSARTQEPPARKAERASIDNQMKALKSEIESNLNRIAYDISQGLLDRAGMKCEIVARQRLRLKELAGKWSEITMQDAKPATPINYRPGARLERKVKRYKMFSEV